jgi:hypothetical protein
MPIENFPDALIPLIQIGILEREMEEGLDSVMAYRGTALFETIPNRVGETVTKTRKGRKAPVTTPMVPANNTGLDNGLTPSSFSIEQYQFSIDQYGDTCDVKLMQDQVAIASEFIANARNNAVQAAQSLERIHRRKLFGAYLSGNTRVLASAAPTSTAAHVDDIRGFQTVLVTGVVTPVSGGYPLTVYEIDSAGETRTTLTVTGAVADGVNVSESPDGVSGVLTYTSDPSQAPVADNALVAANSPIVLRSAGRLTFKHLQQTDVLTFGILQDSEAYLRDNGVPAMEDGTYHVILNNTSMRQLFSDQQFMVLFAGRDMAREYRDGQVISLTGLTLIPTTETYVVAIDNVDDTPIRIQRPIVIGAEASIQGNFEGLEIFLEQVGLDNLDGTVALVDGVLQIIREPLSRLQDDIAQTWTWIGDFAIPTDLTATVDIIPTASNSLYKRCVVIEHC